MDASPTSAFDAARNTARPTLYALRPGAVPAPVTSARSDDPLQQLGAIVRYQRNRSIYFEGDDAENCFRVRTGTVRLCKVTEDGRRQIAAFLTAGDLFGWTEGST